ncbi:MAG: hypothetical protein ABIQ15_05440 [Nocardioides sp.]
MTTGTSRRVVLHVGLPKTGTTYLQGLLADNRDRLRDEGLLYPFLRPGGMFHAAVEVRGSHDKFGLDADLVAGSWAALCARAREHDGTTVISHEVLGGATEDEIAAALAPLAGLDVHVVVTARDLARQATAHWQEEVKLGDARSFADFERDQFRADLPPGSVPRPHFWHAQDFGEALRRWSTAVPPERVHLVVCPPSGAPADTLWRRFAEALGVEPGVLDAARPGDRVNASLGSTQIALLRGVNASLDGGLPPALHTRVVKRLFAEQVLAAHPGTPPRAPAELVALLDGVTRTWLPAVAAAGHPVHGELEDLLPVAPPVGTPHPDDVAARDELGVAVDALAGLLAAAARASHEAGPAGPSPRGVADAGRPARGPGLLRRGLASARRRR